MSEDRVRHTLRYFVRSYVTKPTTINAMTDIPANIPRPIGSTEIFFPGIWKADAAALADDEAVALSAADVPLLDKEVVVAPDNDMVLVGSGSYVKVRVPYHGNGRGMIDSQTLTPQDSDLLNSRALVLMRTKAMQWRCSPGGQKKRPLAAVTTTKNSKLGPRLTTEGTEDDAEVVVDVLSAEEVEVVVDEEEREVDVEVVVDGGDEEMVDELLPDWATAVIVHCRTTCTRGSPFGPLTGVIVIVHVSVTGPESLQQRELVNSERPSRITTTRTSRTSALSG